MLPPKMQGESHIYILYKHAHDDIYTFTVPSFRPPLRSGTSQLISRKLSYLLNSYIHTHSLSLSPFSPTYALSWAFLFLFRWPIFRERETKTLIASRLYTYYTRTRERERGRKEERGGGARDIRWGKGTRDDECERKGEKPWPGYTTHRARLL